MQLEIKKIGNFPGIILPKELLAQLDLKQGDKVFATIEPDKAVKLARHDPQHAAVMWLAHDVMHAYHVTLTELAK
jgi:putative addiction module antidote